jgi:hypothetical protein
MACTLNHHTLSPCQHTDKISGLSSSTTARTVSLLTSPCGSTVLRRRRCKQFILREAVRTAQDAESVGKNNHRVLSHERYPRTSMSDTVDTTIGNNFGLCSSHFHPKVKLSLSLNSRLRCDAGIRLDLSHLFIYLCSMHNPAHAMREYAPMQQLASSLPLGCLSKRYYSALPLTHFLMASTDDYLCRLAQTSCLPRARSSRTLTDPLELGT